MTLKRLLLLLAQLQVMSIAEPLSRQTEQHPPYDPCPTDEYWSAGHCCKTCPPGTYVEKPCLSPRTRGKCTTCGSGMFTAHSNGLDSCLQCTTCREDQEMVAECSATSDRICHCRAGHFYQDPESNELCSPCTMCPPGVHVLQKCNSTANTVCALAGSDHNYWLFMLFLLVLPTAGAAFYFPRKIMSWPCSLKNTMQHRLCRLTTGASITPAIGTIRKSSVDVDTNNSSTSETEEENLL